MRPVPLSRFLAHQRTFKVNVVGVLLLFLLFLFVVVVVIVRQVACAEDMREQLVLHVRECLLLCSLFTFEEVFRLVSQRLLLLLLLVRRLRNTSFLLRPE